MQLSDFITGGMVSAFTTVSAGEALSAGDVTVQASDGKAYYAIDPSGLYSALRPIAQAATSYNVAALPATTLTTTNSTNSTTFALSNGNVGIVYAQSANLYFTAIGPDGTVAVPQTLIASDYSSKATAISLSGGGFAVAYVSTNTYPCLAIFSSAGTVVSAEQSIETTTANGNAGPQLCQMTGGNIVVFYQTTAAAGFAIYTPGGAAVVGPTALANMLGGVLVPCGTGFVIGYNAGTQAAKASAYSSAGVLLGTVTSTTTLSSASGASILAIPLVGGNALVMFYNPGSPSTVTGMVGLIISPAGASVANSILCFSGYGMPVAQLAATADGGFVALFCSTILTAQRVSATGALVGTVIQIDNSVTMTSASLIRAATLPDGGMTVAYAAGPGAIKLARLTSTFALAAAPVTTTVSSDNPAIVAAPISLTPPPYTSIFLIAGAVAGTGVMFGVFSTVVQACQPIGVTKTPVVAGSTASVQVLGAQATRLKFAKPYSIDARTSTPPGQRMSVVGALAILNGIQ